MFVLSNVNGKCAEPCKNALVLVSNYIILPNNYCYLKRPNYQHYSNYLHPVNVLNAKNALDVELRDIYAPFIGSKGEVKANKGK